ncbi:hypothetical protein FA13DRAFT_341981 [Coprinellus micaceus]|uniref:Uncharacterized protein n=1 Tax=Coprinellus micaceus TaxID=71717 RepID=A0A4Y7TCR2_COPMI|nr:hypothetical protein FA13DRAFT_341981 [Coprinellus micaceus]
MKALRGLGKDERNTLHIGNTNLAMRIVCAYLAEYHANPKHRSRKAEPPVTYNVTNHNYGTVNNVGHVENATFNASRTSSSTHNPTRPSSYTNQPRPRSSANPVSTLSSPPPGSSYPQKTAPRSKQTPSALKSFHMAMLGGAGKGAKGRASEREVLEPSPGV